MVTFRGDTTLGDDSYNNDKRVLLSESNIATL